ncbi:MULTISPECIES: HAD family hydrolase [Shewanella]|uniref:HAD family hydrolase n=1 Tax=Shewanella marisflavi TaxID=260364 RepID=A0AAC9U1E5_9GAMM|nr:MULTISPECIES: HAD-IA family hydrolase [Shewanella]ASJ97137.1 HAD family hydrolase [Shewanella marisflavi]MCL1042303.1 HAD-IA family hydrolase [Shewanella marisflavi]QDF75675.1 HAD-IA family hydrolase [Shewanella marisflavi]
MKRYELVIFDWDGTLMDSVSKIVACMQQTAIELSMMVPSESSIRDIIGLSMDEALNVLHPSACQQTRKAMIDVYRKQYLQLNQTPSPVFEGAEQLLVTLKASGHQLAVATGKARAGLDRVLNETGFVEHFMASRCADEAKSKPHPQMLHELLELVGVAPEKAVMIGDSVHDLNMANNAGIDGIGVSYGAHSAQKLSEANPVAIAARPLELLPLITGQA